MIISPASFWRSRCCDINMSGQKDSWSRSRVYKNLLRDTRELFQAMIVKGLIILVCVVALGSSQSTNNSADCLQQMVRWCEGMNYPQQGAGMAMLSISYGESGGYYRVFCSSDNEGTNCTRNGQPWFACVRVDDSNNTFTYKGQVTPPEGDDEICATADKALNDLFVQNLSYDNNTLQTVLEKSMESFFSQMAAMQEQIEQLQRRLNFMPVFGIDDEWGKSETIPPGKTDYETTTESSNHIEKE